MDQKDTSKSSWTRRLSQKIKSTIGDKDTSTQQTTKQKETSTNPFSRDYAPPQDKGKTVSRDTNHDQARYEQEQDIAGHTSTRTRSRSSHARSSVTQDTIEEDPIIGLDMKGKARRRSSLASENRPGSSRVAGLPDPFVEAPTHLTAERQNYDDDMPYEPRPSYQAHARDYVAPPPGQLIRKSQDNTRHSRSSNEHSRLSSINPFRRSNRSSFDEAQNTAAPIPAKNRTSIPRKEVPMSVDTQEKMHASRTHGSTTVPSSPATADLHATRVASTGTDTSDTPIYDEFKHRDLPLKAQASLMDDAQRLLNHEDVNLVSNRPHPIDTGLESGMQNMVLKSPDSPTSFTSAHDHFPQNDIDSQSATIANDRPTAEQIVERSKFNSADTTLHERVAPAVTHETIYKKVHEITEERITREFHHYHHVHRVLPVHEVEFLPAKHFRLVNGVQVEMKPEEVPQSRVDAWESAMIPKVSA